MSNYSQKPQGRGQTDKTQNYSSNKCSEQFQMLDLLPVLSHTVSRHYLVFCHLEVNMRLPASAQNFLLEDKDLLSAVCLDSWEYLQEYSLLLQALWHILAESCILLLYFHSCHEAFQKTAVELPGFVTTTALLLPGPSHKQKQFPPCVLIWKTDFVTTSRGNLQEHTAVAQSFSRHCAPLSLLFKQRGVNNCGQIWV